MNSLGIERHRGIWMKAPTWRVFVSFLDSDGQPHSHDGESAQAACDNAWKWLNEYKPAVERLSEILGCKLVA